MLSLLLHVLNNSKNCDISYLALYYQTDITAYLYKSITEAPVQLLVSYKKEKR